MCYYFTNFISLFLSTQPAKNIIMAIRIVNEINNSNIDLIQFSTTNLINGIYNIVINQNDKKIATSNFVVSH